MLVTNPDILMSGLTLIGSQVPVNESGDYADELTEGGVGWRPE